MADDENGAEDFEERKKKAIQEEEEPEEEPEQEGMDTLSIASPYPIGRMSNRA